VRRLAVAAGVGLAAVAAVLAVSSGFIGSIGGPSTHRDGDGPLGSIGKPGYESLVVPQTVIGSTTYGIPLCVVDPEVPASITAVTPTVSIGSGYRTLGIAARSFEPTDSHTPIIGVEGFPPPASFVSDPLTKVEGFVVRTACDSGPTDPYTELLVGLAAVGLDGGGWHGIDITYLAAGRTWRLQLDHDLLICGRSLDSIPGACRPEDLVPPAVPSASVHAG
jgi:hypothetical protein